MKRDHPKQTLPEETHDMDAVGQPEHPPLETILKRQRPKREGCVGLAGNRIAPLDVPGGKDLMQAALAGSASSFLAGKATTSLAGGAVTSLAGRPGTSLLILAKEEIPQGTVIKEADLEAFVISEPVSDLDRSILKENPVGKVAKKNFPAFSVIASVVLAGTPSTPVTDVKLPPGGALVYRTKKTVPKGTLIQETDLEPYVISSPIKSRDMYDRKEDLVGKVAKKSIEGHTILKKRMVK